MFVQHEAAALDNILSRRAHNILSTSYTMGPTNEQEFLILPEHLGSPFFWWRTRCSIVRFLRGVCLFFWQLYYLSFDLRLLIVSFSKLFLPFCLRHAFHQFKFVWTKCLNSEDRQFHQYQENEKTSFTLTHWILIWVLMLQKKPVISNTCHFFCFKSIVSYTKSVLHYMCSS